MTKEEYLNKHKEICNKMHEITKAKNADYCGSGNDPFKNFKIIEMYELMTAEQGIFCRMSDKMSRMSTFLQGNSLQVKDESFEDTCLDLANYAILLALLNKSRKNYE